MYLRNFILNTLIFYLYKMILDINKKKYHAHENEFAQINIQEFCNLRILNDVGLFERLISLFSQLKYCGVRNLVCFEPTHGGFLPIECSKFCNNITLINSSAEHENNIKTNIQNHNIKNISLVNYQSLQNSDNYNKSIIFSNNFLNIHPVFLNEYKNNIFITNRNMNSIYLNTFSHVYRLTNTDFYIHLNENSIANFKETFQYYFEEENGKTVLNYDNLIHLCIMVKNGGPQFEDMLVKNLPIIDRWTILDTGSTDNTIEIIKKILVGKKKGELFQEAFINFKDSRNRCLDLADTDCKYTIMLDDTYIIEGNLRNFLQTIRGDQYSDSFSLMIKSDDVEYGSNRIIKSATGLRYKHRIHEIIDDNNNINIIIPKNYAVINDEKYDYMEERTMKRKELDLKLLYEEVEENPNDPRAYYYLAQTYNLLEKYELAFEFFLKRGSFTNSGFIQERIDAAFEAARVANFKLNKPWEECLELYEKAFKIDESRPETQYFIGIHHYLNGDNKTAFKYFKLAYEIGYPVHCQYGLKPTLSFHFLPKFLCKLCYEMKEYKLGEAAAELFFQNNPPSADSYQEIVSWYNIYKQLNLCPKKEGPIFSSKPIFCFVADGGFSSWSGKNILTSGVGGSETYIIEMARYIQLSGEYDVVVFCKCEEEEVFEGVVYKPLSTMHSYIYKNYIHTCIVSRFSEYLPVVFNGWTESVYIVLHDLGPSGLVIPLDPKLKNVFCLTEWHVDHVNANFPALSHLTVPFYYGIDFSKFKKDVVKIPYKFIYSSFPNRGLLQLLQMWPKIYERQPLATLYIYADINGKWVNEVALDQMKAIKELLVDYRKREFGLGIHYCGWVDKKTLANSWCSADIWFYPCIFMETFCLTALEAALTKTLVISNDLAALQNTVADRGVVIKGDAMNQEWERAALQKIFEYMNPLNINKKNALIERNYEWASKISWENQAKNLLTRYILPNNKLEYKQLFNWTIDSFNKEDKQKFLNIVGFFNTNYVSALNRSAKILEINTNTGASLIAVVKLISNSLGLGIDNWKSYNGLNEIDTLEIEKSFYKNIATENLTHRINSIKGDSKDILLDMVAKNDAGFDFIYINGIREISNFNMDIFLSWKLLNKGGIIAINTNYYNLNDGLTDRMKIAVEILNKFLYDKNGQYEILFQNGSQIFLAKV